MPVFSQEDCRMQPEDFQPVIAAFNPYFTDHEWNPQTRMELARLADNRLLIIAQEGCVRHYLTFTLVLPPEEVQPTARFWTEEFKALLYKTYYGQAGYQEFKTEFDRQIDEKVPLYGFNQQFNFPIGTRNFVGEVSWMPDKQPSLTLKIIEFVFKERVATPLAPAGSPDDDGWKAGSGQ
jgi:hypothetical protein